MSWWGQREVPDGESEYAALRKLVRCIHAGDVGTTYETLHQLVDFTPVDDGHVVGLLVELMGSPALQDESRRAISTAIERLFKRHDAALRGLVDLLEDVAGKIRASASDLLSRLVRSEDHAPCVCDIASRLDNINATARAACIHCLHAIVANSGHLHKLCVAALCTKLKSPHAYCRDSAIDGLVLLARMGERDDLIGQIVGCLQDPSDVVRTTTVGAVGALVKADPGSYQGWIMAAAECMDHKDGPIRTTGREALAELSSGSGSSSGVSKGKMGKTRQSLLLDPWHLGYGKPGRPCIVDDHLLQEPQPQKGVNAKSSNSRATVAHIGKRLEDPNPSVRESAVASLCALRDEGEHDRLDLIRCSAMRLDYDDDDVRSTAVNALSHLVRGNVADEVEVILNWLEQPVDKGPNNTRVYAVKALGKVAKHNDARVVKALLNSSSDPDYRVIREALKVLDQVAHFGP